jgi:PTH1 family peptidyl-tRNA hydrolase
LPTHFQLIVGLGNPGREYVDTRHNIGFMIADRLAARHEAGWRTEKRWQAEIARAGESWICKPQTYMNLSGQAVAAVAGFYKIAADSILVILDDFALPLGKLRFRSTGSAGGHNGLQSVIDHFGTQSVPRLRVGIGAAEMPNAIDHVLGRFRSEEKGLVAETLEHATAAVECAQGQGIAVAMNTFN